MDQIIIHVDMDAFYASVEIRDNPSLKGKPLIIGSLPKERGVVATCSYEARTYGVKSGMNIKEAYRLCPKGIYMHPDYNKYKAVSQKLHEIWYSYASEAEAIALDEAYLDITEKAKDEEGARRIAQLIKQRTKDEVGLTCSVGLAYSKTAAKIASEEMKPNGYFEILNKEDFIKLIIDRDVRILYTVGAKTAEKLYQSGISTVRDIYNNEEKVKKLLGKQGEWIVNMAKGEDHRKVTSYKPEDAKSIGHEVTFQKDVDDFAYVKDVLVLLALCVKQRADRYHLKGHGVTLKMTYADMKGITRSRKTEVIDSAAEIYRNAVELLDNVEKRPIRLIGVSMYQLTKEEREMTLFDLLEDREDNNEKYMQERLLDLQKKYGLDFAANLEKIYQIETLHKTVEYMRRHK